MGRWLRRRDRDGRRRKRGRHCSLHHEHGRAPTASCPSGGNYPPLSPTFSARIDGYARYQKQTTCDNREKAGVAEFRDFVLNTYPCTGDFGISRSCSAGGTSEHKEGRAWDWRVYVGNPAADRLLEWLLATDRHGNRHAMARRLGVMYMIWNRKIWSASRASEGWRRYTGSNPHTDHVHFSFSWDAARKKTTWFTGGGGGGGGGGGALPCFYGGRQGVCQNTSTSCDGEYRSNLCNGPSNIKCCLPPEKPVDWGTCKKSGKEGICQDTGKTCDGSYASGLCPGPSNVRCCLPKKTKPDYGTCTASGKPGVCQDSGVDSCDGNYVSGLCPGGSTIRCCVSWGSCTYQGKTGTCQSTGKTCGGSYKSGLCPGPSDVKCCVE
jgi:hypothetical protein